MSRIPKHLAYQTDQEPVAEDVSRHTGLVKRIAYQMMSRLPASVEIDDLIQVGLIGLMEAARQFDPLQGVLFETFATQRIRGAMLDELRRLDWLPRQARKQAKQIEDAIFRLENQLGRSAQESEIAAFLEMDLESYQQALFECKGHQIVYFEDFATDKEEASHPAEMLRDEGQVNPIDILGEDQFRSALVEAIKTLPERDQMVMSLYYEQELNLREIGEVLGVTESRVCQLHTQAVSRLRSKLKIWL